MQIIDFIIIIIKIENIKKSLFSFHILKLRDWLFAAF